ncbi:MAG: DUF3048 domain-containing protein [Bacillota bacterium]|nr:DUF3048 domain-containing protein [Bacillota bacterium]
MLNKILKNKKIMIISSVVLIAFVVVMIIHIGNKRAVKTFSELAGLYDADGIFMLSIRDGMSGEDAVLENMEQVIEVFEMIKGLTYTRDKKQEKRTGWQYAVDIYEDEKSFVRLLFAGSSVHFQHHELGIGGSFTVNPGAYYAADRDINTDLESFYTAALLAKRLAQEAADAEAEAEAKRNETVKVKELYPAITVVFDNNYLARPHSGLQYADIVYEFFVEGVSTRYLVVFKTLHEENFTIGPIRSLRPYFAVQSLEYGGIVAHSGYSVRTAEMIRGLGIREIGDYGHFWRDASRRAPHNLYSNINNLYRAVGKLPLASEKEYRFKTEFTGSFVEADLIEINYATLNRVRYEYNEEKDVYYRFINDEPHTDRETGEQYYADRVIIRDTTHKNVPGPEGLVDIYLDGAGKGLLYESGKKYDITWEKSGRETIFLFMGGEPVEPVYGTTWIQVVRK